MHLNFIWKTEIMFQPLVSPQLPSIARTEPGPSQQPECSIRTSCRCGRNPGTLAIPCYFPRCALAGSRNQEWSQDLNPRIVMWEAGAPSNVIWVHPTPLQELSHFLSSVSLKLIYVLHLCQHYLPAPLTFHWVWSSFT